MIVDTIKIENNNIEAIYKNISTYLFDNNIVNNKSLIYDEFIQREKIGSIKIYDDMYLPHIVSSNILINSILRIVGSKFKVLFILVRENTDNTKFFNVVNALLEREFVDRIFSCPNNEFKDIIIKI
ncbi:PTS sugar transporter subunit IIA [Gemella sp. GH3]|uniref:PTS sugar transporter subunit IIA n=1 Tax=unclassified Gemella TaxID=2624949 RepID=UPI0015D04704|nr:MULTISPECIES: PTS sugar transporter subunit IIA [unclassified Gemella]MBF0714016.1 PTS sugar transporter subunit IIA [Gemella sp. GH3.1]NYS50968.1 PTS sugar transporter subunit IIA [Gemella sp. GH3]